jgi:hypothetical protein
MRISLTANSRLSDRTNSIHFRSNIRALPYLPLRSDPGNLGAMDEARHRRRPDRMTARLTTGSIA